MATLPSLPNEIPLEKLTTGLFTGTGVIDRLMQAADNYIDHEFKQGRIKGPEYAQVCLGLIEAAMKNGVDFLLQQQKAALEAQLIEAQIRLADKQVEIAQIELEIKQAELPKIEAEILLINAQKDKVLAETQNLDVERLRIIAQTSLINQQTTNAVQEHEVLVAQECKLKGEYDLIMQNVLKAAQETALLAQKVVTERAQTQSTGVAVDSVIGRQKELYTAQANGFLRDAEQKAAKIMVESWNVRRTTDEGTVADATNKLADSYVGGAVSKLLSGVGAVPT